MAAPNKKALAWPVFDRIVTDALAASPESPWDGGTYKPDYATLSVLLAVPLHLAADTTSGVPALALDVWVAYELRRAGFDEDAVWPRADHPRIMPGPIAALRTAWTPKADREKTLDAKLYKVSPLKGVVATSANVLGKHYVKQVDVVMSAWDTGPEILISTKRMDSSFGKNAANRVEESYGDAKNLRSRHPLAALGFVYALRSTILQQEPDKADWLIDLLQKLGREDDAYDAVALLMIEYGGDPVEGSDGGQDNDALAAAGITESVEEPAAEPESGFNVAEHVEKALSELHLHPVKILDVPKALEAGTFLAKIVRHVLAATPITMHETARKRAGWPVVGKKQEQGGDAIEVAPI